MEQELINELFFKGKSEKTNSVTMNSHQAGEVTIKNIYGMLEKKYRINEADRMMKKRY